MTQVNGALARNVQNAPGNKTRPWASTGASARGDDTCHDFGAGQSRPDCVLKVSV